MIHAEFFKRGKVLLGFRISGHSGMAEAGADIVCAAVSSAAYMAANTITDIVKANADVSVKDGFMSLKIPTAESTSCRVVLEGFHVYMVSLQKQYSNYITLTDMEV